MFCPTCGKDNAREQKYCASCGTNLETVAQALAGGDDNFFVKMDSGIDQFIARYSEHVFKSAPLDATDRKVGGSWRLLGKAIVTSFLDILLFFLMWNLLPLRFIILLISTPFRLLADRGGRGEDRRPNELGSRPRAELEIPVPAELAAAPPAVPSVTENTTKNLVGQRRGRHTRSE
jgi:hypothetical protein